tara:strand:- start:933 stop:2081 length:1149 start_codon:yes stop_codon:yes gene_type:complete
MNIATPYLNSKNALSHIPLVKPSITKKEISYVNDAIKNGWGSKKNHYIEKFENSFTKKIGIKYGVSTSSCTGALHLGLAALGIKKGDEIIVPESTWIASVAPLVHLGAKPVFVDIMEDSWCIDPNLVENAITSKTKAIICVHLYGNLCELNQLKKISKKYNIPLIEDSAEAFGSYYSKKHVGTFGTFGVFSFHGSKTISTGEGGMLVTDDENIYNKVKILNDHGVNRELDQQYFPSQLGYKFKMTNTQAAMGLAQLERSDEILMKKIKIMDFYKDYFSANKSISFNIEKRGNKNSYWMPTALFHNQKDFFISNLIAEFQFQNIDARSFFWPLSSLNFFKENKNNKISRDIPLRAINLPSFFDINESQLTKICNILESRNHDI